MIKIAFATHAARTYPHPRWGGLPDAGQQAWLFDWVAGEGFRGLDVGDSWVDFARLDRSNALAMRQRASERGLEICALNCLRKALCDPATSGLNSDALTHALDVSEWLGCPTVGISLSHPTQVHGGSATIGTTHSPGGSAAASDHDYEATCRALRSLAARAKEKGLSLSVELHHCSLADTSAGLLRILDGVAASNVGANPDLINGYWAYAEPPETWRDAFSALVPRTNLWHVKNAQRVYVPEARRAVFLERPLSQGDIDYRWALRKAESAGFGGWISIENCGGGDPFEITSEGRKYLHRLLATR